MSGVRNLEDESYDVSVYLQRARERKKREEDAKTSRARSRALLTARETSLGLDKASGTRSFVSTEMVGEREVKRGAGFFCEVCMCTLRDSQAYMAHLNSRNHLANAGIAMRVERSSASQVKQRFAKHAKNTKRRHTPLTKGPTETSSDERNEPQKKRARVEGGAPRGEAGEASEVGGSLEEGALRSGDDRGEGADGKKDEADGGGEGQENEGDKGDDTNDFMKMMGFSSFGTSKKC